MVKEAMGTIPIDFLVPIDDTSEIDDDVVNILEGFKKN